MALNRRKLGSILLLTSGVVAALAVFLLYSETAMRWALNAAFSAMPQRISVEVMEGRLTGPIQLQGIHYDQEGVSIDVARLNIDWQPRALLGGEIRFTLLEADDIHVELLPSPRPAPVDEAPFERVDITLPVAVVLERLALQRISIKGPGSETPVLLSRLSAVLGFDRNTLVLDDLVAEGPQFSLSAKGRLAPQGAYPLKLETVFAIHLPESPLIEGKVELTGDLERLAIRQDLSRPARASLTAKVEHVLAQPLWDARLEMDRFSLSDLNPAWEPLALEGKILSEGSEDSFAMEARLQGDYLAEPWEARLDARHEDGTWHVLQLVLMLPQCDVQLDLQGEAELTADRQAVDMAGTWRNLGWPLQGERLVESPAGRLRLSGTPDDYRFEIDGQVQGTDIPAGRWSLAGNGTTRSVEIRRLQGNLLDGRVEGGGALAWDPGLTWRFDLRGSALDPSAQWAGVPEQLGFSLLGDGALEEGRYTAHVSLEDLSGSLQGASISGQANIDVDQGQITVSPLVLKAGSSFLVMEGDLGEQWSLSWRMDAPDLQQFYPTLAGSIESRGSISGSSGLPSVSGLLEGRGLAYGAHRVAHASVVLDWDPSDVDTSNVEMHLVDVETEGRHIRQVDILGTGRASQHTIHLWADASWAQLLGRIQGGYQAEVWKGEVDGVRLILPPSGVWHSTGAAQIVAGRERFSLKAWCLAGEADARMCMEGHWEEKGGGEGHVMAENLPLQVAGHWLPADISIDGRGRLDLHGVLTPSGDVEATAGFVSDEGVAAFEVTREDTVSLTYSDFQVNGRLRQGMASLGVNADLGDQGGLEGQLQIPVASLNPVSNQVEGAFEASLREFGMLTLLIPDAENIAGDLQARARVEGTPDDVTLDLDFDFSKGSIAFPAQGVTVEDIALRIRSDGKQENILNFEGGARSGPGTLHARGLFRPGRSHDWHLELDVTGKRFLAMNTPEYHVLVSPDLTLSVGHEKANISGVVTIPEAVLKPKSFSGAVHPSRDAIVVSGEETGQGGFAVHSNVRIQLGDYVRFDGFGLKGFITGQIQVIDVPGQLTSGTGELGIREGTFRAYGQNLIIERGRLVFVGGPIDTPGLDIRAIRKVEDVTVGFNVSGDIIEPRLNIFSDPAMSDTEALSYLLLGRPLERDETGKDNELSGAALALGVGGASLFGKKLGEGLGIDEVGIETESGTGELQLKMGTYLSPKLYVGYSRSLAEQLNIYMVRYRLSKRLTVSGESSSEAVGGDLLYTIEKD